MLDNLNVTTEKARDAIVQVVGVGSDDTAPGPAQQIPFTALGKKVLEKSLREALSLGHNYIGTEHILLALGRVNDGLGVSVLSRWTSPEEVRDEVIGLLSGSREKEAKEERARQERELRSVRISKLAAMVEHDFDEASRLWDREVELQNILGVDEEPVLRIETTNFETESNFEAERVHTHEFGLDPDEQGSDEEETSSDGIHDALGQAQDALSKVFLDAADFLEHVTDAIDSIRLRME